MYSLEGRSRKEEGNVNKISQGNDELDFTALRLELRNTPIDRIIRYKYFHSSDPHNRCALEVVT